MADFDNILCTNVRESNAPLGDERSYTTLLRDLGYVVTSKCETFLRQESGRQIRWDTNFAYGDRTIITSDSFAIGDSSVHCRALLHRHGRVSRHFLRIQRMMFRPRATPRDATFFRLFLSAQACPIASWLSIDGCGGQVSQWVYWLEGLGFAMIPWDWCYAEIFESVDACIARAKSYDGRGVQAGRQIELDNLEVNELKTRAGLDAWSC